MLQLYNTHAIIPPLVCYDTVITHVQLLLCLLSSYICRARTRILTRVSAIQLHLLELPTRRFKLEYYSIQNLRKTNNPYIYPYACCNVTVAAVMGHNIMLILLLMI